MLSTPYHYLLKRAPNLEQVTNPRLLYCLCVNTLVYLASLWLLTGGGQYEFLDASPLAYLIKNLIFNALLFFCLFYILRFIPFGIYAEWILCALYFLIGIVDIFLTLTFQTQLNNTFFVIFLSTNFAEARDFLQLYLSPHIVFILGAFIASSLVFFFICNFLSRFLLPFLKIPARFTQALALATFLISLSIMSYKLYIYSQITILQIYLNDKNMASRWYNTIVDSLIEQSAFLKQYANLSIQMSENLEKIKNDEMVSNALNLPNIVFIIGESTQRELMSLYGYPLPTTPNLENLRKKGNLIIFEDFISSFASTDKSLQRILTFSNYENSQTPWFMHQNLIDLLNLAEYKTHWLSNQDMISIYGNSPEIIAKRANFTRFTTTSDSLMAGKPTDGILLPMLDEVLKDSQKLAQNSQPMFYAIHLMGTHAGYNGRYPKSFETFSVQDLKTHNLDTLPKDQKLNSSQLLTKVQYLNAVLYNDYVVSEIMKRFEDKDALIFYLSDHGEEVYDLRDFSGHSDGNTSRFMLEIPAMVYISEKFKQNHPEIVQKLQNARQRPFMTDDFIHSFLDITGITSKEFEKTRSVFAPEYNAKRERIVGGKNYDKELKLAP